jgi:steroid delta-isomerase
VFVAGNGAAVKWTGRGTSTNGKEVKFEGIDVFEVAEDGKIQNVWAYWNPAEMIAQL